MKRLMIAMLGTSLPLSVQAQAPIQATAIQASTVLPQNTPVYLTLNDTLSTRSKQVKAGNTFTLSVSRNVRLGQYIVIPRGAKAIGTITWRTKKGGFGKSGKMEFSLDYIEVGDQRIPIEGKHREEGEGNSTATVATFVFVSMLGSGFITGHSAEIPAGREFTAWTKEDVPVQFPGADPASVPAAGVVMAGMPANAPMTTAAPLPHEFGNRHVKCETCR
ncbi:hypothetical protein KRR38_18960 [Novosphingobium sp. G106]|uniref:hypothetical protein n=1 Tax=Novosphingobium sp. G106 TaxID=2849500 RepID=UPI001C2DA444|nr:hypothetical protein [Novosphingobium sp. G106]MBV1689704.1 hypothetical protein [Novosphingobium sp. G106]